LDPDTKDSAAAHGAACGHKDQGCDHDGSEDVNVFPPHHLLETHLPKKEDNISLFDYFFCSNRNAFQSNPLKRHQENVRTGQTECAVAVLLPLYFPMLNFNTFFVLVFIHSFSGRI
jgi:hypothetical protein